MVHKLCLENFIDNRVEVLTTGTFDHLPILVTARHKGFSSGSRKRPFRYEAKWALKEDGEEVIRQAWQQHTFDPNCWAQLNSKLVICNRHLRTWNAKKAKLSKRELDEKVVELKVL